MSVWLDQRASEIRASIAEIGRLRDQLSYLQVGWTPPDGGWSIGQVFEHLIISDSSYMPRLRELIANGSRGDSSYKPTFGGRMLIRSLQPTSTRKVTTPRIWRPGPQPRANVIEEYRKVREELLQLVERAGDVDIRRNRMHSPVTRWIRLTLGDAIMVLNVHTQRHLQQVARIRARPGFPQSSD